MNRIVVWFPLHAIVLSILAVRYPECLIGFKSAITLLLGVVMFTKGMTLNLNDFKHFRFSLGG
jgi:predicted Na+-dependent transporter